MRQMLRGSMAAYRSSEPRVPGGLHAADVARVDGRLALLRTTGARWAPCGRCCEGRWPPIAPQNHGCQVGSMRQMLRGSMAAYRSSEPRVPGGLHAADVA